MRGAREKPEQGGGYRVRGETTFGRPLKRGHLHSHEQEDLVRELSRWREACLRDGRDVRERCWGGCVGEEVFLAVCALAVRWSPEHTLRNKALCRG